MLSERVIIVVMRLLGSELVGRFLTTAKSEPVIDVAACCSAPKLDRLARDPNLVGLIEDRSCKTPKAGTASWTTGSWKRKLGTTPLRMPRMLLVTLPRPPPLGRAIFFAMEPTR